MVGGDILEIMATSDNVVRAGLTPKLRDVPTLLSMLNQTLEEESQNQGGGDDGRSEVIPVQQSPFLKVYSPPPPFSEFELDLISWREEDHQDLEEEVVVVELFETSSSPSILLVLEGEGVVSPLIMDDEDQDLDLRDQTISKGSTLLLSPSIPFSITTTTSSGSRFLAARAHTKEIREEGKEHKEEESS